MNYIAMDHQGTIFGTTAQGGIWKRGDDNESWVALPGCGKDITIASTDGSLFVIGFDDGMVYAFDSE